MILSQSGLDNYYKLAAIDSTKDDDFSYEDFRKLVDTLIDDKTIRKFIISQC